LEQKLDPADKTTAITWTAVMGIHPSYARRKVIPMDLMADLTNAWEVAMERQFQENDILVSCTISPSMTIYPQSMGCPNWGEETVILSGSSHPGFVSRSMFDAYIAAVESVVREVAEAMNQESVRIDFTETTRSVHFELKKADKDSQKDS
jgi:hypothetical protein